MGLVREGIVTRTIYPTNPVQAEYGLTECGHSIRNPSWRSAPACGKRSLSSPSWRYRRSVPTRFPVLLPPVFPGREVRNNHSIPLASRAMRACALPKETPATRTARHPQSEAPRSRAGPLDVADGIVSAARARSLYRVALPSDGNVDWPETQCLCAG
jgi:hypothetical protein